MRAANSSSLPARPSATTMQASLPDWMRMPRIRSSTFTSESMSTNILEPCMAQAFWLTWKVSVSLTSPRFSASNSM